MDQFRSVPFDLLVFWIIVMYSWNGPSDSAHQLQICGSSGGLHSKMNVLWRMFTIYILMQIYNNKCPVLSDHDMFLPWSLQEDADPVK